MANYNTSFIVNAADLAKILQQIKIAEADAATPVIMHLKKSLCLGCEKVFEIKNCFRNNEFSQHHQPEFTLFLMIQPHDKQAAENSVTTFSPRALLKKAELKKSAWSDLQKVITYFNPAR